MEESKPKETSTVYAIGSPGPELDRVKQLQRQDPSLADLLGYFERGEIRENLVSSRRLMATAEDYVLEEGISYHLDKGPVRKRNSVRKQLVVPRAFKNEVILSLHEEITSGHLGFEKTYLKIRLRYFWTGMHTEIQRLCASCVDCATKKAPRKLPKAPLQPYMYLYSIFT